VERPGAGGFTESGATIDVSGGGVFGTSDGSTAAGGTSVLVISAVPDPEPASVVMGATSVLVGLGYWWRRRVRIVGLNPPTDPPPAAIPRAVPETDLGSPRPRTFRAYSIRLGPRPAAVSVRTPRGIPPPAAQTALWQLA